MSDDLRVRVARAIYEADRESGYDADDPATFWMAEDGYWPPSQKMFIWESWMRIADRAIAIVWNEAIEAGVDLAQSEQGTTAEMIASAIAALRKPAEGE